jgi:hypothetical protein
MRLCPDGSAFPADALFAVLDEDALLGQLFPDRITAGEVACPAGLISFLHQRIDFSVGK